MNNHTYPPPPARARAKNAGGPLPLFSASLFRLLDQVEELDDEIADSMSSLRGESAEQARTFQASLSMLSENLTVALRTFNDELNDVLENRVSNIQAAITITNATLR